MFSADIPTAVYRPLLTVRAQSLTKDLRNHLTLYTLFNQSHDPETCIHPTCGHSPLKALILWTRGLILSSPTVLCAIRVRSRLEVC